MSTRTEELRERVAEELCRQGFAVQAMRKFVIGFGIFVLLIVVAAVIRSRVAAESTIVSIEDAGDFVNATMTPGTLSRPAICRVETTKGVFLLQGVTVGGLKCEPCRVITCDDGCRYLQIGGHRCYLFEVE